MKEIAYWRPVDSLYHTDRFPEGSLWQGFGEVASSSKTGNHSLLFPFLVSLRVEVCHSGDDLAGGHCGNCPEVFVVVWLIG